MIFDFIYHKRDGLRERRGQRCRVIARGKGPGPRNKLIEFPDGFRCVTTFYGVRKEKGNERDCAHLDSHRRSAVAGLPKMAEETVRSGVVLSRA